jgi:tetratricopeptide (TPR) repeat protein
VSVIVVCPKCTKRQPVNVAVPPDGLRYSCAFCQTAFLVKLPRGSAAPPPAKQPTMAPPPMASPPADAGGLEMPLPDDFLDLPSVGGADRPAPRPSQWDLPAARPRTMAAPGLVLPVAHANDKRSRPFSLDLPAARVDMPLPDDFLSSSESDSDDLPAAREDMPLPDDFPASRDQVPHPGDLPAARDATMQLLPEDLFGVAARDEVPRPGDLPAPREDIPMPGDYLASREDMPLPGDYPASREDMPMPGDYLAPRDEVPRPGDYPAPRDQIPRPGDYPGARDQIPRPGDYPGAREAIPMPGDFLAPRDEIPRPGDLPAARDEAALPRNLLSPVGQVGGRGNLPTSRTGAPPIPTDAARADHPSGEVPPAGADFDPFASDFEQSARSPLAPLDLGRNGGPTLTPAGALDDQRRYGLELEGREEAPAGDDGPQPVRVVMPGAHSDDASVERLGPVVARRRGGAEIVNPKAGPARRRGLIIAGVGALALGGAAVVVVLNVRKAEPVAEDVLRPLAADLNRDVYQSYQKSADRLMEVNGRRPDAVGLRASAAEQLLIAFLAHGGDRSKLSQAEQLVNALPASDTPAPAVARARALLALAKGKPGESVGQLGTEASTPSGALVLGLRDLTIKPEAAAGALRRFLAARPDRVVGHFLLGRALEESSPADAVKEYKIALAANPRHFAAALGLARLTELPGERLANIQKLLDTNVVGVPRGELAEGYVALGQAALVAGRSSDASAAFNKALAADPQNAAANIALGEGFMIEGRYIDALQRFQAAGPAGLRNTAGKFGLGGALLATGMTEQGTAQIRQAAQENPKDPRGLYYTGFAAEIGRPPDLEAAAQDYRAALKLDRAFLPASLRLAALMERQERPDEALAVLKQAQEAGASAAALQIAWGEALITAKQPARAEEVFRKAIADSPKDAPPHLGLAEALDAQGKSDQARKVLEDAVAAVPESLSLRDRLAAQEAKLGHKEEALAHYKAEVATGAAPATARVSLAKLALELGHLEEAKDELDKVIDDNPSTPDALFTLARLWEARGDLPKALSEYRRALRFDNTPYLQLSFARALIRFKKEAEAMAALDAAASIPEGLLERGKLLFRRGEYDRAQADFEAASKLAPRDAEALLWVGSSRDKLGQMDRAGEAWRAGIKLAPDDPELRFRLGKLELDKGRVSSALEQLRRAAAKAPEDAEWIAELYFQLGTAEATSGARGPAVAAFKKYLDRAAPDAPARPEVAKQIQRLGGR